MALSLQQISKVMMFKQKGEKDESLRLEVRIGNTALSTSYGFKQITANTKCGLTTGEVKTTVAETFICNTPLDGRYLSLQSGANVALSVAEITVYTKGQFCPL